MSRLGPKSNRTGLPRGYRMPLRDIRSKSQMPNHNVKPSAVPLVCIVDDDASMADSTRYLVRSFGFRAEDFLSAQKFLDSGLVEETKCLILILDLRMPGMDGLELQRHLTSASKRIPIIFVSARAN